LSLTSPSIATLGLEEEAALLAVGGFLAIMELPHVFVLLLDYFA
jgi:hypothetical protein